MPFTALGISHRQRGQGLTSGSVPNQILSDLDELAAIRLLARF
jgi:hypothetical protein